MLKTKVRTKPREIYRVVMQRQSYQMAHSVLKSFLNIKLLFSYTIYHKLTVTKHYGTPHDHFFVFILIFRTSVNLEIGKPTSGDNQFCGFLSLSSEVGEIVHTNTQTIHFIFTHHSFIRPL